MTNYENIISCDEKQLAELLAELITAMLTQSGVLAVDNRFKIVLAGNLYSWLNDEIIRGKYLN